MYRDGTSIESTAVTATEKNVCTQTTTHDVRHIEK